MGKDEFAFHGRCQRCHISEERWFILHACVFFSLLFTVHGTIFEWNMTQSQIPRCQHVDKDDAETNNLMSENSTYVWDNLKDELI